MKISNKVLLQLGAFIIKWIRADMDKGIMQNDTNNHKYSEDYAKYKANEMRKFGRGKNKKGKGERLKRYIGIPIASTHTAYVNLYLTGDLRKNMICEAIENGVRILYGARDTGKILGALDNGRDIVNLRNENKEKTVKFLENNIEQDILKEIKFENIKVVANLK